MLLTEAFVLLDFHKNDIVANLADAVPGDDTFTFTSPETAESSGTGKNQRFNFSGFTVEFQIYRTAETFTGTGIDYFFLF